MLDAGFGQQAKGPIDLAGRRRIIKAKAKIAHNLFQVNAADEAAKPLAKLLPLAPKKPHPFHGFSRNLFLWFFLCFLLGRFFFLGQIPRKERDAQEGKGHLFC